MRNHSVLATAAVIALLSGCESKTDKVSAVGPEARQAISEAAVARYPGNPMTSRDVTVTAVNYPDKKYLELHNPGSTGIPQSTVWVNGTFMTTIDGIPPKGVVEVQHGSLLEAGAGTGDLRSLNQPVAKVEIQTPRGLFTVQGPTIKRD